MYATGRYAQTTFPHFAHFLHAAAQHSGHSREESLHKTSTMAVTGEPAAGLGQQCGSTRALTLSACLPTHTCKYSPLKEGVQMALHTCAHFLLL